MIRELLKLGNPNLYESSSPIEQEELPQVKNWVEDLHDTLMEYRRVYGAGRAVAAPQIGVQKRLLDLLSAAFGISSNKIYIAEAKK